MTYQEIVEKLKCRISLQRNIAEQFYMPKDMLAELDIAVLELIKSQKAGNEGANAVYCRDCVHNVANWQHDELDMTDYTDITCDYFMTDGMRPNDFCSRGKRCETERSNTQ